MQKLTITAKNGKSYFHASLEAGKLKLEYEIYAHGADSADMETIYTIAEVEFPKITQKYGKPDGAGDIFETLSHIEECDRVQELKKDIECGFIALADKFVWMSFDD